MAEEITMSPSISPYESLLGILQQMQGLSQQPILPDNPLAQAGAILQGFSAGTQGKANPAIDFYTKQRQLQMTGLLGQATVGGALATVETAKAHRQDTLDKMFIDVHQGLLKSDSLEGRTLGARGLLDFSSKKFGIQAPSDLASRIATKMLTADEEKRVIADFVLAQEQGQEPNLNDIQRSVPNFLPTDFAYYRDLSRNEAALKTRFGPTFTTAGDLAETARKRQVAEHKDTLTLLGLGGENRIESDARTYIQTHMKKQPWEATPNEAATAKEFVAAQLKSREDERLQLAQQHFGLAKQSLALAAGRVSQQQYDAHIKPLQLNINILDNLKSLQVLVDKLPNLPKAGATLAGTSLANFKRAWENPTDPTLFQFKQLWPAVIIGMDRGFFGEINVRTKLAFEPQLGATKSPPSAEAFHELFDLLRTRIQEQVRSQGQLSRMMPLEPSVQAQLDQIISAVGTPSSIKSLMGDY